MLEQRVRAVHREASRKLRNVRGKAESAQIQRTLDCAYLDADRQLPHPSAEQRGRAPGLAVLPAIPRFRLWCGTKLTEHWHTRYPVEVVVYGHLHLRSTRWRDGRFEEVSLGRPTEWIKQRDPSANVRQILPWLGGERIDVRHP